MKTWHYELGIVSTILIITTFLFASNWINWLTTFAVIVTFNHAIIGDRLQEKQAKMDKPTVECYYKLHRLFVTKEILWIISFILMKNYAAIIGSAMFSIYPLWRRYYRMKIKPLED